MARTRARERAEATSTASESESAQSGNETLRPAAAPVLSPDDFRKAEASDTETAPLAAQTTTSKAKPRKRGRPAKARAIAQAPQPSPQRDEDMAGQGTRVFKPSRSARKTTRPVKPSATMRVRNHHALVFDEETTDSTNATSGDSVKSESISQPDGSHSDESAPRVQRKASHLSTSSADGRDDDGEGPKGNAHMEDGDVGEDTVWVPMDDLEEVQGSTVTPETFRALAQQARPALDRIFAAGDSAHWLAEDGECLRRFMGCRGTFDDDRREDIILEIFELSPEQSDEDFLATQLMDITIFLILARDMNDAPQQLQDSLPIALNGFNTSIVPLGLPLSAAILDLHLAMRVHLILARAQTGHGLVRNVNKDVLECDTQLLIRFVDDGKQDLLDVVLARGEETLNQIFLGDDSLTDLLEQHPYESFLLAYLHHVKDVFGYLRKPTQHVRPARLASDTAKLSSPDLFYAHVARKQLNKDRERRLSAPPPDFESGNSPLRGLRQSLRRLSTPVHIRTSNGRQPPRISSSRLPIGTHHSSSEGSSEEVQSALLFRSSAPRAISEEASDAHSDADEISRQSHNDEAGASILQPQIESQEAETMVPHGDLVGQSARSLFFDDDGPQQAVDALATMDEAPFVTDNYNDFFEDDMLPGPYIPGRSDAPSPSQGQGIDTFSQISDEHTNADPETAFEDEAGRQMDHVTDAPHGADEVLDQPSNSYSTAFSWTERQSDAEKINMSSPARKHRTAADLSKRGAPSSRVAHKHGHAKTRLSSTEQLAISDKEHLLSPARSTSAGKGTRPISASVNAFIDSEAGFEANEESGDGSSGNAARKSAQASILSKARKGKGRAIAPESGIDPEQTTTRLTLPSHKGRQVTPESSNVRVPHSLRSIRSVHYEDDIYEGGATRSAPERQTEGEVEDEYVDELASSSDTAAPVASTSVAHLPPRKRKTAPVTSASKKKVRQTATPQQRRTPSATSEEESRDNRTESTPGREPSPSSSEEDLGGDKNSKAEIREKRRLFLAAVAKWKEREAVQSQEFEELKHQYNSIDLLYPEYQDGARRVQPTQNQRKTQLWEERERRTLLVAMALLPNPLYARRYRLVLLDHGVNGLVTRRLETRHGGHLKDKLVNEAKRREKDGLEPLPWAMSTVVLDGKEHRAVTRTRVRNRDGTPEATEG